MDQERVNELTAPFMIKAFPVATRKRAAACAVKRRENMGTWMARASDRQADLEAGDAVLPPTRDAPAAAVPAAAELSGLIQAIALAMSVPRVDASVLKEGATTVKMLFRAARGLPLRSAGRARALGLTPRETLDQSG